MWEKGQSLRHFLAKMPPPFAQGRQEWGIYKGQCPKMKCHPHMICGWIFYRKNANSENKFI